MGGGEEKLWRMAERRRSGLIIQSRCCTSASNTRVLTDRETEEKREKISENWRKHTNIAADSGHPPDINGRIWRLRRPLEKSISGGRADWSFDRVADRLHYSIVAFAVCLGSVAIFVGAERPTMDDDHR